MPKKKVGHKGKAKNSVEQAEDAPFAGNSLQNVSEEEYTTVVDFESSNKYSKRQVQNNWAKYEENFSDAVSSDEEKDEHKLEDFESLLKTASSDCSHFQFKSEKSWRNEENFIPKSDDVFDLDVNRLAKGLACLPFHERIDLKEEDFSQEDIDRFNEEAEKNWEEYRKFLGEKDNVEQETKDQEDTGTESPTPNASVEEDTRVEEQISDIKAPEKTKRTFFSENDENLEDWLDSVLDD